MMQDDEGTLTRVLFLMSHRKLWVIFAFLNRPGLIPVYRVSSTFFFFCGQNVGVFPGSLT